MGVIDGDQESSIEWCDTECTVCGDDWSRCEHVDGTGELRLDDHERDGRGERCDDGIIISDSGGSEWGELGPERCVSSWMQCVGSQSVEVEQCIDHSCHVRGKTGTGGRQQHGVSGVDVEWILDVRWRIDNESEEVEWRVDRGVECDSCGIECREGDREPSDSTFQEWHGGDDVDVRECCAQQK